MVECGANGRHRGRGPGRARHRPRARSRRSVAAHRGAARQGRQGEDRGRRRPRSTRASGRARSSASHGPKLDEATQIHEKLARQDAAKAVEEEVLEQYAGAGDDGGRPRAAGRGLPRLRQAREGHHPHAGSRRQEAARRPRPGRDPADRVRGGHLPARPRLGALHPRRDADPLQRRARHDARWTCGSTTSACRRRRRFWHHYNFPPFSVGEAGFMRGPKRRDIGHGALAERALVPIDPESGGLPVRDPGGLGHARVERLLVDGLGLRLLDGADGRRRAGLARRSPASRWA